MAKSQHISKGIDQVWVKRDRVDTCMEQVYGSTSPIMVIGPSRSGKQSYVTRRHHRDSVLWNRGERTWRDPKKAIGVLLRFSDYRAIQNKYMLFDRLQKDLLSDLGRQLFGEESSLVEEFYERTGRAVESGWDFFRILSDILSESRYHYAGRVNLYLCGLQYIYPSLLGNFVDYFRAFIDSVTGIPKLERFRLIMTSLEDGYHLTDDRTDVCSPLNCANHVIMEDFSSSEMETFMSAVSKKVRIVLKDQLSLYKCTEGDVYIAKVILSFCQNNLVDSAAELNQRPYVVTDSEIREGIDYVLSLPVSSEIPPFTVLRQYLEENEGIREIMYQLVSGEDAVRVTDLSGVYSLPESCGAVARIVQNDCYAYRFRNEVYRRFVEKYFHDQDRRAEAILLGCTGEGEMSYPGTLASSIHHEMSGPIGVIGAELSRLFDDPDLSADSQDSLDMILAANSRLSTLSAFLSDFWTPHARVEEVDLNRYLTENVSIFIPHLARRGVVLAFDFDTRVGRLTVDTPALRIALVNLLINARDAVVAKGQGTVKVRTRSKPRGRTEISIQDTGIGMDKATRLRALEYGFTTRPEGRGIGLMICKTAARRMHAELSIKSRPGRGTTVSLLLRRRGTDEAETNPHS